jgi:hypothetical protein
MAEQARAEMFVGMGLLCTGGKKLVNQSPEKCEASMLKT